MSLSLIDSRTVVLEYPRILQFGAAECGKTVAAASVSKLFPQEVYEGKKPTKHVHLKDTLFVVFDNGGLDSLAEHNVSAPILPYRIGDKVVAKSHAGLSGGAIIPAIEQIGKDVAEAVEKLGIENVVLDTFSTLDGSISAYCQNKFSDEKDQRRVWGQVLGIHLRLIELMRPIKATVIYNCHAKDQQEATGAESDKQRVTRLAAGLKTDGGVITPEITGRAFRIYNASCSLVLPITAVKDKVGGKQVVKRFYHPGGYQNLVSKNRFQSLLDATEPTNLRALLDKVRNRIHLLDVNADAPPDSAAAAALDILNKT